MSHIRYFVLPAASGWSIRRDCKRLSACLEEAEAIRTALEAAAIDRVRGHRVDVVSQDPDGRWRPHPAWRR